jgi:hypothetical protein
LYAAGHRDGETLSLLGSAWNGLYESTGNLLYLRRSRDIYRLAYELENHFYAGINVAVKSLLLGEHAMAEEFAKNVVTQVQSKSYYPDPHKGLIVAEMLLITREFEAARSAYQRVIDRNFEYQGLLDQSYKQARKICAALGLSDSDTVATLAPFQMLRELR